MDQNRDVEELLLEAEDVQDFSVATFLVFLSRAVIHVYMLSLMREVDIQLQTFYLWIIIQLARSLGPL